MQFTGRDDDDIFGIQNVCFFIYDALIYVFNGHDDFGVGVPVLRIIFTFRVLKYPNLEISVVIYGFMDSI